MPVRCGFHRDEQAERHLIHRRIAFIPENGDGLDLFLRERMTVLEPSVAKSRIPGVKLNSTETLRLTQQAFHMGKALEHLILDAIRLFLRISDLHLSLDVHGVFVVGAAGPCLSLTRMTYRIFLSISHLASEKVPTVILLRHGIKVLPQAIRLCIGKGKGFYSRQRESSDTNEKGGQHEFHG